MEERGKPGKGWREERGVAREGMEGGKGSRQKKAGRKETGLLKSKMGRGFS